MTLAIICTETMRDGFTKAFAEIAPALDVRVWPETGAIDDIRYALVWHPPHGALASLPNLQVIFSIGAGVDHVLTDPDLPGVPLVRFVDLDLTMRMGEYVCLHVLTHHRRMLDYAELKAKAEWQEIQPQPAASEIRVGVMGLGVLGHDAAQKLKLLGYDVCGWSRSQKQIGGVTCFAGEDGLKLFLSRSDILVCLLPHTPDTHGLLNEELISLLAKDGPLPGPVLINAGRGKVQVEEDIVAALESGTLWAASLDVFEEEPLPGTSPLWTHPRTIITPHNASISSDTAVCRYVAAQITRYKRGEGLENVVNPTKGY